MSEGRKGIQLWHLVAAAIVLLVAWRTPAMYRNYHAICSDINRALSDEEFIDLAIAEIIKDQKSRLTRQNTDEGYTPGDAGYVPLPAGETSPLILYASVAEFKQINPGCCATEKDYLDEGLLAKLVFGTPTRVHLVYRRYTTGPRPSVSATIHMLQCGRTVERYIGRSREFITLYPQYITLYPQ